MNIENQVCAIEQGKALKKLGVFGLPQFVHIDNFYLKTNRVGFVKPTYKHNGKIADGGVIRFYPAFTISELHVMLPDNLIKDKGIQYILSTTKDYDYMTENLSYTWGYYNFIQHDWYYGVGDISPLSCAAELLIRLIDHGKTTVQEVNERLKNA